MSPLEFNISSRSLPSAHATALRRLAMQLLRDPGEAEDAVQETWLRALAHRPAGATLPAARRWLEAVLRNVVRRRARDRHRRQAREQRAARDEQLPPTVDLVMQRETLQALTTAVLTLEPDLQRVVFARWFEGQPPREIARREGRPVAAVYRDLERARRALREQLEGRLGRREWSRRLALLCGLRRGVRTAPLSWACGVLGGFLVMKKFALILIGAAALAVGITLWDVQPAPAVLTARPRPDTAAAPLTAALDDETDTSRTPVRGAAKATTPQNLAPYEFELEFRVRDEDDLPAASTQLWLAPENHQLNTARTDEDGSLRLVWRGRVPQMTIVFGSPSDVAGRARLQRRVVLAGQPIVVPLRVRAPSEPHAIAVRAVLMDDLGTPVTGYAYAPHGSLAALMRHADGTCEFVTGTESDFDRGDDLLGLIQARSQFRGSWNVSFALPPATGVEAEEARQQPPGRLLGVVHHPDGRPAANALVMLGLAPGRRGPQSTTTDDQGAFEIDDVDPGRYHARSGGGDLGLAQTVLDIAPGGTRTWHPTLDRGHELRARLVDAKGQPLAGWAVEAMHRHDTTGWIDGAVTADDGSFAIPNVEPVQHELRVRPKDSAVTAWRGTLWPDATDMVLTLPADAVAGGSVRLQLQRLNGAPATRGELRLWREGEDEGVRTLQGSDEDLRVTHLAPGAYRPTFLGPGRAARAFDAAAIPPDAEMDLGILTLDECTVLEIPHGADANPTADDSVPLLRLHDSVVSLAGTLTNDAERVLLPPGRYLVGTDQREIELKPGLNQLPQ
ncbi:MAG: sigma-70 family RNA polymerase sigma factor [Planctomycetota bacterium]